MDVPIAGASPTKKVGRPHQRNSLGKSVFWQSLVVVLVSQVRNLRHYKN